jgi:hypothetical protein
MYLLRQPRFVELERNVCNTLLTSAGYCTDNAWPAFFISTSQPPGIFPTIIKVCNLITIYGDLSKTQKMIITSSR